MNLLSFPSEIILNIIECLPQQSRCQLSKTCSKLNEECSKVLYRNILIRDNEVLYDINYKWTIVKNLSKLPQIIQNRRLDHLQKLYIFGESHNTSTIIELINTCAERCLGVDIKFHDCEVRGITRSSMENYQLTNPNIRHLTLSTDTMCDINQDLDALTIDILSRKAVDGDNRIFQKQSHFKGIKELNLSRDTDSSLTFLNWYISSPFPLNLNKFFFSIEHRRLDPNSLSLVLVFIRFMEIVNVEYLGQLELEIGCDDINCECVTDILASLNHEKLERLKKLSVIQKSWKLNHNLTELWDLRVLNFISKLPQLEYLSISHTRDKFMIPDDGVEGNFVRRKTLYSKIIPQLNNLKWLILPSFMQSCSYYEQVTNDLLWNGCTCAECEPILSDIDTFLMNHHFYDAEDYSLKDVITSIFFGVVGSVLSREYQNMDNLSFDFANCLPTCKQDWKLHDEMACIEECDLEISLEDLTTVCSHFMSDFISIFMEATSLEYVVLNNVTFKCGYEANGTRYFKRIYV